MCSNYVVTRSLAELSRAFNARVKEDFKFQPHLYPWFEGPVLVLEGGERVIRRMRFGMVPHWDKGTDKPKTKMHNARSETAATKKEFAESYRKRRCLVPVDYFYEHVVRDGVKGKIRIKLEPKSGETMMAAGIWHTWTSSTGEKHDAYSILTQEPPAVILEAGHDRCPIFLREDAWDDWMAEEEMEPRDLMPILMLEADIEWKITDAPQPPRPPRPPKDPAAKAGIVKAKGPVKRKAPPKKPKGEQPTLFDSN